MRSQYLAKLAHELNSQPLPTLPETFDVLRLPPPHQRLGQVNFDIVPDSRLVLEQEGANVDEDEEDGESESESEDEEEARTEDGDVRGMRTVDGDHEGEGEDEEMEEVGMEGAVQRREVDEDYDT